VATKHRPAWILAALVCAVSLAVSSSGYASTQASPSITQAEPGPRILRVYNNNIENLVVNNPDGTCTRVSGPNHLTSMLVDDNGQTGTSAISPPDLLIVQQVRGTGQAQAYANQLGAKFGYPAGTYKAIVAWSDPEPWGTTHKCSQQELGDLKKKQTNAIIYNTKRLSLAAGDISAFWSAGWLKPGTAYNNGAGCTLYKPPNNDSAASLRDKWKRTSAIAARFTLKDTGTTVFAATMHLPQENGQHACAGDGDTGIGNTGIHIGADATSLMNASTIRIVGIDANRKGIPAATLSGFGLTGYGSTTTLGSSKIDYLFVKGSVLASPIDHTVNGTKSNHRALYAFITY